MLHRSPHGKAIRGCSLLAIHEMSNCEEFGKENKVYCGDAAIWILKHPVVNEISQNFLKFCITVSETMLIIIAIIYMSRSLRSFLPKFEFNKESQNHCFYGEKYVKDRQPLCRMPLLIYLFCCLVLQTFKCSLILDCE